MEKLTPYNVEYYYVSQATNQLMEKQMSGDHTIIDNLLSLNDRLRQTPQEEQLFFLHSLLMLWGNLVARDEIAHEEWFNNASKFVGMRYDK